MQTCPHHLAPGQSAGQVTASLWTLAARPNPAGFGRRSFSVQPATVSPAAIPMPDAPRVRPTRGPPASNGRAPADRSAPGPAAAIRLPAEDHERIAQGLNDVVAGRLFSTGLDLQTALELIGDHRVAGKIERALGELDLAIRDLRDAVFDRWAT
jgi:hypothetical protein